MIYFFFSLLFGCLVTFWRLLHLLLTFDLHTLYDYFEYKNELFLREKKRVKKERKKKSNGYTMYDAQEIIIKGYAWSHLAFLHRVPILIIIRIHSQWDIPQDFHVSTHHWFSCMFWHAKIQANNIISRHAHTHNVDTSFAIFNIWQRSTEFEA